MMYGKELFFLLYTIISINSIKSQNSEVITKLCDFNNKNNDLNNYKLINCAPNTDVIINQGEESLCIYVDNRNGKYTKSSIEIDGGVTSIELISNVTKVQQIADKYKFKVNLGEVKLRLLTLTQTQSKIKLENKLCNKQRRKRNIIKTINSNDCSAPARSRTPTITYGELVKKGFYPWHAAIFKLTSTQSEYICGGTLINSNTVLTAAHCLLENSNEVSPDRLIIKLGIVKLFQDGQIHYVRKLVTHEYFHQEFFRHDIALIRLNTNVRYSTYIRPICVTNFDIEYINTNGWIPGWGKTEATIISNDLIEAALPGRTNEDCEANNKDFYETYVDPEYSFCAGNANGTSICSGDSGGGLVFERNNKWFIRGIASLAPANVRGCDITKFILFTDVVKHFNWIEDTLNSLSPDSVHVQSQGQAKVPISRVTTEGNCNVQARDENLKLTENKILPDGYFPWHVKIFKIRPNLDDEYLCGGSIIKPNIILTAGECVFSLNVKTDPSRLYIRTGSNILRSGEKFTVQSYRDHSGHEPDTWSYNIALILLHKPVTYTFNVKPVCWKSGTFDLTGTEGHLPSTLYNYEHTDRESAFTERLTELKIPVTSNEDCKKTNDYDYTNFYHPETMFCGGFVNVTEKDKNICWGDLGTGLVFKQQHGWVVRGIVDRFNAKCEHSGSSYYTDILPYHNWIETNMQSLLKESIGVPTYPVDISCTVPARDQDQITKTEILPEGYFPWHVKIFRVRPDQEDEYRGAGNLISQDIVLTSAECIYYSKKIVENNRLYIRVGTNTRKFGERFGIKYKRSHFGHHADKWDHNIAVLILNRPVTYSYTVRPVCRTNQAFEIIGVKGYIPSVLYDFEKKAGELGFKDYITEIRLPAVTLEECKIKNDVSFEIFNKTENMFCAAQMNSSEKDKNVCWGDVGAGLVYKLPTGWILRGIVCRFDAVCDHKKTSYYTDIVPYYDWIDKTIRELRAI